VYSLITEDIRVRAFSEHVVDRSSPDMEVFAFRYTIEIENLSGHAVQLLERHWFITSGESPVAEVFGAGVVGQQPVLAAGDTYRYTSGAIIPDPIGFMEGSYTFRSDAGEYIQVVIPKFDLTYPLIVH
jgi:ApaG protein